MLVNYLSGKKSIIYYISILFVVERRNQQCSLELLNYVHIIIPYIPFQE